MLCYQTDIGEWIDTLSQLARALVDADEAEPGTPAEREREPALLAQAVVQLGEVLRRVEHDAHAGAARSAGDGLPGGDLSELGDYGMALVDELSAHARRLGDTEMLARLQELLLRFALWVVRRGGELRRLEALVNALAAHANQTTDRRRLEELGRCIGELVEGVSPPIAQDLERTNPMRPWRILLLNFGIVATRSHQPLLMERAFEAITLHLPEEAARFFAEGMEQMRALDYPASVRELVERYFYVWGPGRTMH